MRKGKREEGSGEGRGGEGRAHPTLNVGCDIPHK